MKNKLSLVLSLIIAIVVLLSSCQQSDNSVTPTPQPSPQYGNVTFWINESASTITVTFYGGDKTITKYYPNYNPSCGSSGCANYTDIPVGSYYYSARNYYGTYTWSGYVNVQTGCTLMLLSFSKDFNNPELNNDEHTLIEANEFDYENLE